MSSATNEKRGHLEDEFQRRFHDAEASPSPDLWARIDHDLTMQENKHFRGRIVLYRQLAAACFVLFMLAGTLLTYHYKAANNIDAGIAAMQLNTAATNEQEMAASQNPTPEAGMEKVDATVSSQAETTLEAPAVTVLQSPATKAQENTGTIQKVYAANTMPAGKSRSAHTTPAKPATVAIGAIATGTDYSINSASAVSVPSAMAAGQSVFATTSESNAGKSNVPSRFNAGKSFFPSARQAITSVPASYLAKTEQQSIAGETGRTRSLVELSQTALADYLAKQKKAEELAIALNTPAGGSSKEEKTDNTDSRWSLGLAYAPSYFNQNIQMPNQMMNTVSHRSFIAGGADKSLETASNMNDARDEFEANTDPAFSYAAEVKAGFKLFKKIKLLAGVGFTQNTARTKSSYIINQYVYKPGTLERVPLPASTVFLPALNNNFTTDSLSVNKTDDFYVNYRYRHVTLPVALQYDGNISKDWFWYAAGGVAANFLVETAILASSTEVRDVDYDHNDDSPFRKVQFSGNVSAGFGKRISNAISVTAGPEFRGYFNPLLSEPEKALAPQGNPYTIGVNMSVNYNLGQK
ncbi:MAG: PorT family protein [Hymenobacteraceae bacterium]|nr:PorT family protein [Hymenobacteraceae bacterium]